MADNNNSNWDKENKDKKPHNEPPKWGPFNKNNLNPGLLYALGLIVVMFGVNYFFNTNSSDSISFSDFKSKIESGEIHYVQMGQDSYIGLTAAPDNFGSSQGISSYRTTPVNDPGFIPLLDKMGVEYAAQAQGNNFIIDLLITWGIPILLFFLIWRFAFKRMGNMGQNVLSFGQNKNQVVAEGSIETTFRDVAGADEAKEELIEVVDFLKNPAKYKAIGGKIPKGVLLVGPPGGGKTLMARAVAGEAGVTFFRISGADFVEMFVGVGASRVRDLFKQAREKAPCIIFIDELDAIGKSRITGISGNDEREQTLNQLLVEMDGFDAVQGVIIIAATNRPEILDPALLRPGRFDRQVVMDRPDLKGREDILKIHAKNVKLDTSVDLNKVAKGSPGFVGADLANLVNEAALLAVRRGQKKVGQQDFDEAIEKIVAGLERKTRVMNPKEREIVAFHETGHALVAAFTQDADPVHKISIIPRGIGALGYTLQLPTEDRFLMSQKELLGRIDILLGGRAAEEIIFNEISTGAANDLVKATSIARKMITDYGMSQRFRNVSLESDRSSPFLGERSQLGMGQQRQYSENTQMYVDEEITRIIETEYANVLKMLKEKQALLDDIAKKLLEVETLDSEAFKKMVETKAAV
ncbi:MAG: ATP-dependent zinc metalloprotease FtsH [Spirochaetales bacterium]|nr:ATP-dependent zinc metalloprotease FtsH [Spirochaetales bacterium]